MQSVTKKAQKAHIRLSSPPIRNVPGFRWFCYKPGDEVFGGFGSTPTEAWERRMRMRSMEKSYG